MTITFNLAYKKTYKTKIKFITEINSKQTGYEQRYPKYTYPVRSWTLTLEKDLTGREAIESFFASVYGAYGEFQFTWATDMGGDGRTYTCTLDMDELKQQIDYYGYTLTEITFYTIDKGAYTPPADFSTYHKAQANFNTKFFTMVDSVITAANNRLKYWDTPKKYWELTFEKDKTTRQQIEAWFIAKRGKFKSFDWTWDADRGGDDETYTVRMDKDELEIEVNPYGYATISIPLQEVIPTTNPLLEVEKDEIIPRKLLKIELEGGSIYVIDNETLEELTFNGDTYLGAPLSHDQIEKSDESSVSSIGITLSNVGLAISAIIGSRGDVITGAPAVLTLVFLDTSESEPTLISGLNEVIWYGYCNNLKLDYENASMDIETPLGGFERVSPVMRYRPSCQYRRFKDHRCQYNGTEFTTCDRTLTSCKERGNQANFGGFPSIPLETIVKAG